MLLPVERLHGRDYLGVGLGFLGIAIVIQPDPAALLDPMIVGKLLVFAAVVVISLGTVLVRWSGTTLPVPALTAWAMVLGGSIQFMIGLAVGESVASINPTPIAIALVVYLSVALGAVGFVLFLELLGAIGAMKANLTTYVTPIVSLAIGWILLGEPFQPVATVGFGIIVLGFAVLERKTVAVEFGRFRTLYR